MSAHAVPEQPLESVGGEQDALAHVPEAMRYLYRAQLACGIGFHDDEDTALERALELSRMAEAQKTVCAEVGAEIAGKEEGMAEKVERGENHLVNFSLAWKSSAQSFPPTAEETAADEELRAQHQKQSEIDAWYKRRGDLEYELSCLEDSVEDVAKEKIEEVRQLLKDHEKTNPFPEAKDLEEEEEEEEEDDEEEEETHDAKRRKLADAALKRLGA